MTLRKKFELFLATEDYGGRPSVGPPATGYQAIDDVDRTAWNFNNPEFLDGLNFYLSQLQGHLYINPYGILQQLRGKLQLVGLDFDKPLFVGEKGTVDVEVRGWGGRSGYLDNKGTIGNDDGISHIVPEGLKLVFVFSKTQGRYALSATIEKGHAKNGREYHSNASFPHDVDVSQAKHNKP
jgi:hypothetical protein